MPFPWLPADSRSAVGRPSASADCDPETACAPKQRTSQSSRQPARGQSREECNPSPPFVSPCSATGFAESTQGETFLWWPIIACWAGGSGLWFERGAGWPVSSFFFLLLLHDRGRRLLYDCRCGPCAVRWGGKQEFPSGSMWRKSWRQTQHICLQKCSQTPTDGLHFGAV